jgi:hypothetical protein
MLIFGEKSFLRQQQEIFEIFIEKITKIICYASNKIEMKEVTAHLRDHFFGIH